MIMTIFTMFDIILRGHDESLAAIMISGTGPLYIGSIAYFELVGSIAYFELVPVSSQHDHGIPVSRKRKHWPCEHSKF